MKIAGPGQFWILISAWILLSVTFATISWSLGRKVRSESDGCLLIIANLLLIVLGGMLGLVLLRFPMSLMASPFLAFAFPASMTLFWIIRTRRSESP